MALPPDSRFAEDYGILQRVRALGADLVLDDDKAGILARPKGLLGPELKDAVHRNREWVIRTLLFQEALVYFEHHVERQGGSVRDQEDRIYRNGLDTADDELNEAWLEKDLHEFKAALRKWLKLNLQSFTRAWAGRGHAREREEPVEAGTQKTLEQAI